MPNSCMSVGKVTFMAVSTTTPLKDMMPAAMMEKSRRVSSTRAAELLMWKHLASARLGRSALQLWLTLGHDGV